MGLSEPLQAIPTSSPSLSKGLIRIVSPDGLIQKEKFDKHVAERAQHKPEVLSLASHIKTGWAAAHRAKQDIETELLRCLRQRNGEYDPSDLAKIQRHGGTDVFMMLTSVKCRAAEAKMNEVLMPPGDKPWSLDPTPIPELPEDTEAQLIQQVETEALQVLALQGIPFNQDDLDMRLNELHDQMLAEKVKMAKQAMGRMEHHIQDDLLQGGFYPALSDFIKDISTFPTAFLCGPEIKLKRVLVWKRDGDGHWSPSVEPRYTRTYRRVSPFDCYPAPGAKHIQDGYFIERIRYRRTDLMQMIGVEGYNNDAIRGALDDYGRGGLREWLAIDQERFRLENRGLEEDDPDPPIDALIYWGSVQGTKLLEWGIDKSKIPDPWADYQITGILIGNWVVMARTNGHPLGRRPYYATSFETANDAIWGKSPPMLMRDVQEVCNGTARALVNNLSIASGPQGEIATDRLQPGQDAEDIYPWKLWKVKFDTLTGKPAINWFQPDAFSAELIKVYDYFFQQASEQSGIPAYTYGNEKIGGAGEALADYESILTPDGPKQISDITIGDKVCTSYSTSANVTGVFPQGKSDIFRVRFSNGMFVDCDKNHRWSIKDHQARNFRTMTLEALLDKGIFRKTKKSDRCPSGIRPRWMIPKISPTHFMDKKVPIDPYTLGALLGDGDARCRITSEDPEIFKRIPYELGIADKTVSGKAKTRCVKGIRKQYRELGLNCTSLNKFIPQLYLYNSIKIRIELLKGLMDTDGCAGSPGSTFFSTSSEQLAKDFRNLIYSLGGTLKQICEQEGGPFEIKGRHCIRQKMYRLYFNLPGIEIFSLKRKQKLVRKYERCFTYITGVEYIGTHGATCISVDSDDHLFLCSNFIPTHNTASGLAMLLNNANSNMRNVITHIDQEVIVEVIKEHWTHIMLFDDNIYKVGDVKVLARASEYLIMAEQLQLRRGEFLQNTNNPTDLAIMGLKGRASLLREQVKTLKMPNDDVVPTKDEMIIMEGQMAGVMGGEGEVPLLPQGGGGNTAQGSPEAPGGGKQGGEQVKPQEPKVTQ